MVMVMVVNAFLSQTLACYGRKKTFYSFALLLPNHSLVMAEKWREKAFKLKNLLNASMVFELSLIVEGATEKVLQLIMPLKSMNT
jgi:hypothetical protein